jgi:glycosyltransferase involved in cell wall biosynthesis
MKKQMRIAIVTDSAPVRDDVRAWGMSRVNAKLLRAMDKNVICVATARARLSEIAEGFGDRCVIWEKKLFFENRLKKLYSRFIRKSAFERTLPAIANKLKESKVDIILCTCGVDPYSLQHGVLAARASGLPLALYLVDDFLSGAILSENAEHLLVAKRDVPIWLREAKRIFVISAGLQDLIRDRYGLDSEVLPLPYEIPEAHQIQQCVSTEKQIIFVGNLSHFYIDGLRELAGVIDDLNAKEYGTISLRFTLPTMKEVIRQVGRFDCIKCIPCRNTKDLQIEVAKSIFCYSPYSFEDRFKEMVMTSFPSKLLDYLSSARAVLAYGPEYSSMIRYFRCHNLGVVLDRRDPAALRDAVLHQLNSCENYSNLYRKTIIENHSAHVVAAQVLYSLYQYAEGCSICEESLNDGSH